MEPGSEAAVMAAGTAGEELVYTTPPRRGSLTPNQVKQEVSDAFVEPPTVRPEHCPQ